MRWMLVAALLLAGAVRAENSFAGDVCTRDANDASFCAGGKLTEIVIIGTLHGGHYKNSLYSVDVLKDIVLGVRPTAILNELPLSLVDANGVPVHHEYERHPEGWVSVTVAEELGGLPQIPFDMPDRQRYYRRTNYIERRKKSVESFQSFVNELKATDANSMVCKVDQLWYHSIGAQGELNNMGPEIVNCRAYDDVIRIKHLCWKSIFMDVLCKDPGQKELAKEFKFLADTWNMRNEIMASNILKAAADHAGGRLVVLTGSEHRYILRDLLSGEQGIVLKEYYEVEGSLADN